MFCNNCGKEVSEGLNFCNACGSKVGEDAVYGPQPQTTSFSAPPFEDDARKRTTQAVSTLLAMLTVICMLMSWVGGGISAERLAGELMGRLDAYTEANVLSVQYSATVFDVSNAVGKFNQILDLAKRAASSAMSYSGALSSQNESAMYQINAIMGAVGIINFILFVLSLMLAFAVISMVCFAFLMISGKKIGAFFGQLGSMLAVLAAVIFVIFMMVLNFQLKGLMYTMAEPVASMIQIGATVWTYLTILFGVLCFIFIATRKKIIQGE
ncbi:MAG: zinc ribbon domain-containing protein [Clostridia bacterium]|nr:zinc ribbon domain-containing protein [Clostridia bacterium]